MTHLALTYQAAHISSAAVLMMPCRLAHGAGGTLSLFLGSLLQGSKLPGAWQVAGLASSAFSTWTCLPACWRVRSRRPVSAQGHAAFINSTSPLLALTGHVGAGGTAQSWLLEHLTPGSAGSVAPRLLRGPLTGAHPSLRPASAACWHGATLPPRLPCQSLPLHLLWLLTG